ncbi:MAG TPA: hypothetical protein VLA12_00480, partial [Planctomycetaceae bacterium]|nr:hypothetical protein [Planctomycetaceae bacterium]
MKLNRSRHPAISLRTALVLLCVIGCDSADKPAADGSGTANTVEEQHEPEAAQSERKFPELGAANRGETGSSNAEPIPDLIPQPVVRPAFVPPSHDLPQLEAAGIHKYESKSMILYSDIDPNVARTLPPLIDQLVPALENYFQPLPPASDGSPFRIVGYVMNDQLAFRELDLVPPDLPFFKTGRHRDYRFWMLAQETDYYNRHLMLHEATHCFMTILPGTKLPKWYFEGMAELFGTHRLDEQGRLTFRVMPDNREDFDGWGRIKVLRETMDAGNIKRMEDIFAITSIDPQTEIVDYAWSWALAYFLDRHPRYSQQFRSLKDHWLAGGFEEEFNERIGLELLPRLRPEWLWFAAYLTEGIDVERAAIDFRPGSFVDKNSPPAVVKADRGWQSSGWRLEEGDTYRMTADGRVVLGTDPKPWVCEPQGVSIRYYRGKPRGRLVGMIIDENSFPDHPFYELPPDFLDSLESIDLG